MGNMSKYLRGNTFKLLGIVLLIGGWLCTGIGFAVSMPNSFNTVMFIAGLIMAPIGTVMLGTIIFKEYRRL